jgi:hypothetical protein
MKALAPLAMGRQHRYSEKRLKALDPLVRCDSETDCNSQQWMKALGPLAVAQRHIRALRTARADRGH